ncbi:MAG: hypothetical protein KKD39_01755 [Candidatus Altiarchaeota archaeon]|nr:hypothetical protein [Candidatus Altiarchaeota archaeon]
MDVERLVKAKILTPQQADRFCGDFLRGFLLEKGERMLKHGELGWATRVLGVYASMKSADIPVGGDVVALMEEGKLPLEIGKGVEGGLKKVIVQQIRDTFDQPSWSINANLPGYVEALATAGWLDADFRKFIQDRYHGEYDRQVSGKRDTKPLDEIPGPMGAFLRDLRMQTIGIVEQTEDLLQQKDLDRQRRLMEDPFMTVDDYMEGEKQDRETQRHLKMIRRGDHTPVPFTITGLRLSDFSSLMAAGIDLDKFTQGRKDSILEEARQSAAEDDWKHVGQVLYNAQRAKMSGLVKFCIGEQAGEETWKDKIVKAHQGGNIFDAHLLHTLGLLTPKTTSRPNTTE